MSQPAKQGSDSGQRRSRRPLLGLLAVVLVSVLALIVQAVRHFSSPPAPVIPLLTNEEFAGAKKAWESSGIDSYDMDLIFGGGSNVEKIHLEMRDGKVTAITRNGKPPAQERTWEEWTVASQFDMIAADLEKERLGWGVREGVQIVLHAEFDPELGHPKRYLREAAKGRSPLHSHWTVTRFDVVK